MKEFSKSAEKTKHQILEAAIKNIGQSGLSNVTLRSVALTAGLSKGGLTHHYSTKHELLHDVFIYFFENVVRRCEEQVASSEKPMDKLLSFGCIFEQNYPEIKTAHLVLHDFSSVAAHDPFFQDLYEKMVEVWVEMIEKILIAGIADGSIGQCDPDVTARTISAIIHGIATRVYLASKTHSRQWAIDSYNDTISKIVPLTSNKS